MKAKQVFIMPAQVVIRPGGNVKLVELLIKNSVEFNMDLNAKNEYYGKTGFHYACEKYQKVKLVELLIKNSVECNIDLNAKDKYGKTGYHLACQNSQVRIVESLIENSVEFNIDLNAKVNGKTGYDFSSGQDKKLIFDNSAQFNIDLNNYVDPNLAHNPFHNFKFQVVPVDKTKIL